MSQMFAPHPALSLEGVTRRVIDGCGCGETASVYVLTFLAMRYVHWEVLQIDCYLRSDNTLLKAGVPYDIRVHV
jgi:hypothetical protein